jgi:glycosyltransferase involved in cell wall biosynthesis
MSMNVPVISTDITGIPEVVIDGKTGFLTDPGNVEQFSDAISKAWENPEYCTKMGDNARNLMIEKMDKKNQFDAFLNYFEKILAE